MNILMSDGFTPKQIKTQDTTINLVQGGNGDPILLLHSSPQSHVCWHLVAPILAERFTVVCPDLRGFGDSGKPPSDAEHLAYSKRVMARDQVEAMRNLGFDRFAVVGHDRGARVAHRMALDHGKRITRLALLAIIPTSTAFAKVDKEIDCVSLKGDYVEATTDRRLAHRAQQNRTRRSSLSSSGR